MSRIGKQPVPVPTGVEVKISGDSISIKGSKGQLEHTVHQDVTVAQEGSEILVKTKSEKNADRKFQGLTRSLIFNMVHGVSEGFKKSLVLNGVGYRAAAKGKGVTLTLGYSHPIEFDPPEGVTLKVVNQTNIDITGCDKQAVGEVAAVIRRFRPPEPYHGKGVRYSDEVIIKKEGKSAGK